MRSLRCAGFKAHNVTVMDSRLHLRLPAAGRGLAGGGLRWPTPAGRWEAPSAGRIWSVRCSGCLVLGPWRCPSGRHSWPRREVGPAQARPYGVQQLAEPWAVGGPADCSDSEGDCWSDDEESGPASAAAVGSEGFLVINFYYFVELEDPEAEVARHWDFVQSRDIRGRIYINHQGINAQLSGLSRDALAYANWVKQDIRFAGLYLQISPSPQGHAFPRLKLRYKPSLVQVEGGTACLPLTDVGARAIPLTPTEWRERLEQAAASSADLKPDSEHTKSNKVLLLDVRNGYEWDIGHFKGAQRPEVDCFKETEFGFSEMKSVDSDPLAGVDKEKVDVMMYCTGGIRCDVYSTMLRQQGFKNLYTLKGGVARYLKEEGSRNWQGNLFVFDSRLAVPPRGYQDPTSLSAGDVNSCSWEAEPCAKCFLCEELLLEPRHRNCANVECNELFLSCAVCTAVKKGCCSIACASSAKLRPLLDSLQPYDRWHHYRPSEPKPPLPPGHLSRRATKRRLRRERRQQAEASTAAAGMESSDPKDSQVARSSDVFSFMSRKRNPGL